MLDTCTLAVFGEMNSSAAISLLLRPAATRRSTSSSRGQGLAALAARPAARRWTAVPGGQLDAGAPRQHRDLLAQRARAEPGRSRGGAPQPLRGGVPVAAGQRRLGAVQQRHGERMRLAKGLPGGGGPVPAAPHAVGDAAGLARAAVRPVSPAGLARASGAAGGAGRGEGGEQERGVPVGGGEAEPVRLLQAAGRLQLLRDRAQPVRQRGRVVAELLVGCATDL
jgi:hypothetical protein